jgi:anti-sigma factor RsiW
MMPTCNDVRDNLAAYQDGELTATERAPIEAHLAECAVCRREAQAQTAVKAHLRALKQQTADVRPPAHIWANARDAWNRHDAAGRRRVQFRLALVGACLLLMTFGIVWATRVQTSDFPTAIILRDFRGVLENPPRPAFASSDADKAAAWLRSQIQADVPPVRLTLSGAELRGADVLDNTTPRLGRLLYDTPRGLIAVYIAPRGIRFNGLEKRDVNGRGFFLDNKAEDVGLYGWSRGFVGYGLVLSQPVTTGESLAHDAERATSLPAP